MPNVNLIAARRQEKKRLERITRRLFLGLTVESVAVGVLGMTMAVQQMQAHGALSDATARLNSLQPTLDQIKKIETETASLQPRIDTLRTARADTLRWRALLQTVSMSIPSNAWLSSIAATMPSATGSDPASAGVGQAAPPATITIVGTAGSQSLVGETMTRLGSFPVFDKVELRFTQMNNQAGGDAAASRVNFEIAAQLKSTTASTAPTVADELPAAQQAAQNGGGATEGGAGNG